MGVRFKTPWVTRIRVVAPPIIKDIRAFGYRVSCLCLTVRNPIQLATDTMTARTLRTIQAFPASNIYARK